MKWILFLLLCAALLVSLGFWYLEDPGYVKIIWLGYEAQLTVVAGFCIFLFFSFMILVFGRIVGSLLRMPLRWLSFFRRSQDEKAKHGFLDFLSSYEAETFPDALHHQKKAAQRFLNNPIFLWISGNFFEKAEKPFEAEQCFMDLAKNPSSAFLGLKGQIRAAMHRGDFKSAHGLLQRAEKLMPTSPWVLKHFLALTREQKNFKEGEACILRLEDLGYFSSDQCKKQMADLSYLQAIQPETSSAQKELLLRQSHRLDPSHVEAAQEFVLLLQEQGSITYASTVLEETWDVNPKQALGELYLKISSPGDNLAAYQLAHHLVKNNPKHHESLVFLAHTAIKAKLWGDARAHLTNLLNLKETTTADVYQLFARFELEEKQDLQAAIQWLEKGLQAPRHL